MTPQTQRKKKRRRGPRQPLPDNFVCIALDDAQHLFNFIRGLADDHEKEIAKLHFHLCMRCQETVAQLQLIEEEAQRRKELLHCLMTYSGSQAKLKCSHNLNLIRAEKDVAESKAGKLYMKAGGEK